MTSALGRLVLHGVEVELRPLAERDGEVLRAIVTTPKVARWWYPNEDPRWPVADEARATRFAVVVEAEVRGLVQYAETTDPQYRSAALDVLLDPRVHGRGLGTDAVLALARHLFGPAGHHRLTAAPAGANAAAVRCFEKAGFRRVGALRRYERNWQAQTWRDGLLLDLLPDDLP